MDKFLIISHIKIHARVNSDDRIQSLYNATVKSYEWSKFSSIMFSWSTQKLNFHHRKTCCWYVCIYSHALFLKWSIWTCDTPPVLKYFWILGFDAQLSIIMLWLSHCFDLGKVGNLDFLIFNSTAAFDKISKSINCSCLKRLIQVRWN